MEVIWFREEMREVPGKLIRDFLLLLQHFSSFRMQFVDSIPHSVLDGGLVEEAFVFLSFFETFDYFFLVPIDRFLVTSLVKLV